jgi:hypothetical protein
MLMALEGCIGEPTPPPSPSPLQRGTRLASPWFDRDDGYAIRPPFGWTVLEDPVDSRPPFHQPRMLVALASHDVPRHEGGGMCPGRWKAVEDLRRGSALLWLSEYYRASPEAFRARPREFAPSEAARVPGGCWERVSEYRVRFEDRGRFFEAGFVVTLDADDVTRAGAFESMTSLEAEPEPNCPAINPSEQIYDIRPPSGRPGDVVTVSGNTAIGEDGRYAFGTRIEVWWNERFEDVTAQAGPGGSHLVADLPSPAACVFSVRFVVPDAPPGDYPVTLHIYTYPDGSGFGVSRVKQPFVVLDD